MNKVEIRDRFLNRYKHLIKTEMIPYQWKVLNDEIDITIERERNDDSIPNEKSHVIENFRIAAGRKKGNHYGWVFQDSDLYKWLEAVAYTLREQMDEELKCLADDVVDLISEAQEEDGYLDTYFTIEEPGQKYKRLWESHELYCAGHFLEAAVAYYEAAGNQKVLKTACKLADHIDSVFGEEEGKIHGYDGHEEVEIGLMRLYRLTQNDRYLKLARYFLYVRGTDCDAMNSRHLPLTYYQAHLPVLEQDTAEGHAVRLVYLCTAMADAAGGTGDEKLLSACRRLWKSIVSRRMYITGGIGSTVSGEAFTLDYDLPNDTMYCETCASVGLVFFAYRMLLSEAKGEYGDVMERALYNTVLGGVALDGKHFFYVNPLEVVPGKSSKDPLKSHVKCVRPQWLGCACCPPNLARLLASVEQYVFVQKKNKLLVNLFVECKGSFEIEDGILEIELKTGYPWDGCVEIKLNYSGTASVCLGIRVPSWSDTFGAEINQESAAFEAKDGFIYVNQVFREDTIRLKLDMGAKRWYAHPMVENDLGKFAVSRGPIVYCLEEADNGKNLHLLSVEKQEPFEYEFEETLLGGVGVLTASGWKTEVDRKEEGLYRKSNSAEKKVKTKIKWIPYYSWANRGENEMRVWVREDNLR
nr:beta-L-arabinofuranosidase domain-containing protein [uncultured Clostridium sp.]